MTDKEIALGNEILRGVVGSTALGTAMDGVDDRDEMGVFVEPPLNVCGLTSVDHYIQRDQPVGVRSQPGDLDLTMYSLRKFTRLAAQGNPSILILLWIPEHIYKNDLGQQLIDMRDWFFSRSAGERFLGYMEAQRKALAGERNKRVNRPELIEKYGYDTKFAMHALRLGLEGLEYMHNRRLILPHPPEERKLLLDIRHGRLSLKEVLDCISHTQGRLKVLTERCNVKVDRERVNKFLVDAHYDHWGIELPNLA